MGVYFYYGIKHSTLEEEESVELAVSVEPPAQAQVPVLTPAQETTHELFVPAQSFPTWDD
jgi:hypothetical protein